MLCGFFLPLGSKLMLGLFPGRFKFWAFWRGQWRAGGAMIIMLIDAAIDEHAWDALHVLKSCDRWPFFVMHRAWLHDERQKPTVLFFCQFLGLSWRRRYLFVPYLCGPSGDFIMLKRVKRGVIVTRV